MVLDTKYGKGEKSPWNKKFLWLVNLILYIQPLEISFVICHAVFAPGFEVKLVSKACVQEWNTLYAYTKFSYKITCCASKELWWVLSRVFVAHRALGSSPIASTNLKIFFWCRGLLSFYLQVIICIICQECLSGCQNHQLGGCCVELSCWIRLHFLAPRCL